MIPTKAQRGIGPLSDSTLDSGNPVVIISTGITSKAITRGNRNIHKSNFLETIQGESGPVGELLVVCDCGGTWDGIEGAVTSSMDTMELPSALMALNTQNYWSIKTCQELQWPQGGSEFYFLFLRPVLVSSQFEGLLWCPFGLFLEGPHTCFFLLQHSPHQLQHHLGHSLASPTVPFTTLVMTDSWLFSLTTYTKWLNTCYFQLRWDPCRPTSVRNTSWKQPVSTFRWFALLMGVLCMFQLLPGKLRQHELELSKSDSTERQLREKQLNS